MHAGVRSRRRRDTPDKGWIRCELARILVAECANLFDPPSQMYIMDDFARIRTLQVNQSSKWSS